MSTDPLYFDYAASCPPWPEALASFVDVSTNQFANPGGAHGQALAARTGLASARKVMCDLCGCDGARLLVTSGATEANNLVIESHISLHPRAKILIAADVHPSIWYARDRYPDQVIVLPVGTDGGISAAALSAGLLSWPTLVCLSHICNETGVIHDVAAIAASCQRKGAVVLVDGSQALGHIPVEVDVLGCDYYSFTAHKFGGPRGIGGLFFGEPLVPMLRGGPQQWNLRAGTENPAGLAAMGCALKMSIAAMATEGSRLQGLREMLAHRLRQALPDCVVNSREDGVAHIVSVSFPGRAGNELVAALALAGIAVSTGSSCHANETVPSRVLLAMGRKPELANGTIRISMGRDSTSAAIERLADCIIDNARRSHGGTAAR